MARFVTDPERINFTLHPTGKEYNLRLLNRGQAILGTLLGLLPSPYVSTVTGPNYTQLLKSVALELARLELALEDVDRDRDFQKTRSDFLWSIVGYLVLVNSQVPDLGFSDVEFRNFFLNLIRIYLQGSVPKSMSDVVALFLSGNLQVTEAFLLVRQGASGLDISDQFAFNVDHYTPQQNGSLASITAFASGVMTVTNLRDMRLEDIGGNLSLSGAADNNNNGSFQILEVLSATTVRVANPLGSAPDANNGSINWTGPGNSFPANTFIADATIRKLLDLVRPAHTLFKLRYIFSDSYIPGDTIGKILDEMHWTMKVYHYEDFRSFWDGVKDRDRLGRKENQYIVSEDHSDRF